MPSRRELLLWKEVGRSFGFALFKAPCGGTAPLSMAKLIAAGLVRQRKNRYEEEERGWRLERQGK